MVVTASINLLLTIMTVPTPSQHAQQHHEPQHTFEDVDRWIEAFENAERDARQRPDEVIETLSLKPGDIVADIGAGTGYFTRRFAKAVGDTGIAYGVDLEPNMLRYMAARAEKDGQPNIVPVLATESSPSLAPASVDLIFICNTIHHISNRDAYYRILKRTLRDGGRFVVVDFRKDAKLADGPSEAMRLAKNALISEVTASGFALARDHDLLPEQYFVVFTVK